MSDSPAPSGMIIDGIASAQLLDSSSECLMLEGADISSLKSGRACLTWEHKSAHLTTGEENPDHTALDIVGVILDAKKIFKKDDCDNDRQKMYWDKVGVPYLYMVSRLYDAAGHPAAVALAAIIRDHVANNEPPMVEYSVEGATLERDGHELTSTVIRAVTLTVKPCNKAATSGLLLDPQAPKGYKENPNKSQEESIEEILASLTKKEKPIASFAIEINPVVDDLSKMLTAEMGTGAPGTLIGHAALQREDLGNTKKRLSAVARTVAKHYKEKEHGDLSALLKSIIAKMLPDVSDEFIDHYKKVVNDLRVKPSVIKKTELNLQLEAAIVDLHKALLDLRSLKKDEFQVPTQPARGQKPQIKTSSMGPPEHLSRPKAQKSPDKQEPKSLVVDAAKHGHAGLNLDSDQHQLIHGLDMSKPLAMSKIPAHVGEGATEPTWYNDHKGNPVIVKNDSAADESNQRDVGLREAAYHNVAKNFFGMNGFVPTTALFSHPVTGELHSAQAGVEDADHIELNRNNGQPSDPLQRVYLQHHHDNGDIDKLHIMNKVLGNPDRHYGNFLFSSQAPHLRMIDHSVAFRHLAEDDPPAYVKATDRMRQSGGAKPMDEEQAHPEAVKWLMGLNPDHLHQMVHSHLDGNDKAANLSRSFLQQLQNRVKANPKATRDELLNTPFDMGINPGNGPVANIRDAASLKTGR